MVRSTTPSHLGGADRDNTLSGRSTVRGFVTTLYLLRKSEKGSVPFSTSWFGSLALARTPLHHWAALQ